MRTQTEPFGPVLTIFEELLTFVEEESKGITAIVAAEKAGVNGRRLSNKAKMAGRTKRVGCFMRTVQCLENEGRSRNERREGLKMRGGLEN